jgi:molybdopterin molybdotransferase
MTASSAPGGTLLALDDALAAVLERVTPLVAEDVPLERASGRVLADDARAAVDLPPFASSAMDGYAVRAADTPGTLPVTARVAAGRPATRTLEQGEAFAIATGGTVPEGADAVVPYEATASRDAEVEILRAVEPGASVRPRGGDAAAGTVVVARGTLLSPGRIGALAAAGVDTVRCARRPRAAVLTTGTELRRPGEPLRAGEVYEANGLMLAAALAGAGAAPELLGSVADDEDAHRAALERGLEHDVLVTSGGVSVGPHDLVREIERALGVEEVFWRVALKPGKPVSFGVRGSTLVFGLPGNPVSALVCFELFVRSAVLALQGLRDPAPAYLVGELAGDVRENSARDEFVRAFARVDGDRVLLEPITGQESHMIARAAAADALVHVPRGDGVVAAGSPVRYLRLT